MPTLLDLSTELILQILSHCLVPRWPAPQTTKRSPYVSGDNVLARSEYAPPFHWLYKFPWSPLRVSRKIRCEAIEVFFKRNIFCLHDASDTELTSYDWPCKEYVTRVRYKPLWHALPDNTWNLGSYIKAYSRSIKEIYPNFRTLEVVLPIHANWFEFATPTEKLIGQISNCKDSGTVLLLDLENLTDSDKEVFVKALRRLGPSQWTRNLRVSCSESRFLFAITHRDGSTFTQKIHPCLELYRDIWSGV